MRIQELLSNDEFYELCVLLTETIWETLIAHYPLGDIQEGYRRMAFQRPVRKVVRPPMVPKRPFPKPKPLYPERAKISQAQRMAVNPKIDPLNKPPAKPTEWSGKQKVNSVQSTSIKNQQ